MFLQETGRRLDERSKSLSGEPSWIRSNLEVYTHGSTLTSHDWIQLVQSAGDYVLAGLFPENDRKSSALHALLAVCNAVIRMTSTYGQEDRGEINKLKLEVTEALCHIESVVPRTELAVMFHILLHVPDCIYRWNSVRNFWSFFTERFLLLFKCFYYGLISFNSN